MGVVFSRNGTAVRTVKARKEVILSAGVIGSAQLLMLSGIGPSQHLAELQVNIGEFCSILVLIINNFYPGTRVKRRFA